MLNLSFLGVEIITEIFPRRLIHFFLFFLHGLVVDCDGWGSFLHSWRVESHLPLIHGQQLIHDSLFLLHCLSGLVDILNVKERVFRYWHFGLLGPIVVVRLEVRHRLLFDQLLNDHLAHQWVDNF